MTAPFAFAMEMLQACFAMLVTWLKSTGLPNAEAQANFRFDFEQSKTMDSIRPKTAGFGKAFTAGEDRLLTMARHWLSASVLKGM